MLGCKRQFAVVLIAIFACGCATQRSSSNAFAGKPLGGQKAWDVGTLKGVEFRTANYVIHSTVEDAEFNEKLAQIMEGARLQYLALAPSVKPDSRPMDCYVFANRRQWAEFTRQRTGDDAAIYLQINRGGYTIRDFFVAYYIGDTGTFAVASHEGWHQFVSRNFKNRLPPFLEEGIATLFENISFSAGGTPHWNISRNAARAQRLRRSIDEKALWSLPALVGMHAGDVVSQPPERIEAFYAQNWAFVRFMLEADDGLYRPALERMLADAVAGQLVDPSRQAGRGADSFNPEAVRPMLEHYLGMNLASIDAAFLTYMRKIAMDEPSGHFDR